MSFHWHARLHFISAVKRHFMLALVLTFCMLPLQGATLERLSLDDMIAKSTADRPREGHGFSRSIVRSGYLHSLHNPGLGDA